MKKIIAVLLLVFVVFVIYNRHRLYIRDPFGSVTRDGVKDDGAQVYINYSDDVLLENDHPPAYLTVIQHGDHIGTPAVMRGMHYVVYLADADVVPLIAADNSAVIDGMTAKEVKYHNRKHVTVVSLR
jgi:hypothetical protein